MSIIVKLEKVDEGYTIVKKPCPWCTSELVFRIKDKVIQDAIGNGEYSPKEQVVHCKTCTGTSKCSVDEYKLQFR